MNYKTVGALRFLLAIPVAAFAHDGGADPGHTAGPADAAEGCAKSTCHVGTGNPQRGSGVEIAFPGGTNYQPGVKQRWTITVDGASGRGYGFQLSVRLGSNELQQAGRIDTVDAAAQVICQDGAVRTGTRVCSASTPIEYATHTRPNTGGNTFTLEWTPPAAASGNIRVYVAGNAANLNGQPSGDRIFLNNYTLAAGGGTTQAPSIRADNPVLQAFSDQAKLSAGTWIQIFGQNLASNTRSWAAADFRDGRAPTALDGTQVKINGRDAFINYISPTQVNAQAPSDDTGEGPVEVQVITPGGTSTTRLAKTKVSPALLTTPTFRVNNRQYVAALFPDFVTFVGRTGLIQGVNFRPAKPGDTIVIFAVGCGPTAPAIGPGLAAPTPAANLSSPVQFRFGDTVATASGFMAPGAVGLCQFNVTVPNVADGDIALSATVDNIGTGQELFTTIQR